MADRRRLAAALRLRITGIATLVVIVTLVVAGFALATGQRVLLTEALDDAMQQRADDVAAQLTREPVPEVFHGGDDLLVQLTDADGTVLAASPKLAGRAAIASSPPPGEQWIRLVDGLRVEEDRFRVLSRVVNTAGGGATLHVAGSLGDLDEASRAIVVGLVVGTPVLAAVLAALIWWIVGRMLDRVEQANTRMQRFTADAAHELRNPLTRIRAELEVDLTHPDDSDPAATARLVLDEITGLQRLVDDLLTLARSDARDPEPLRLRRVDLDDLLLREVSRLRGEQPISLVTRDLSAAQVTGDPAQLTRAIRNLLDNAVRHAASTVTIGLGERDGHAVLSVADDGSGIPSKQHATVFDRFARLDEARSATSGGAGLGLAITHDIVARHRGEIHVDTEYHDGARFVVTLPT